VLVAGPSSSGKTTFSKRLSIQLLANGLRPFALELDNYFVNREDTPRDELQQAVGKLAQAYPKIAAEAAPLQGKTGDPAYGAVAIDAEDGVIVAGNLASALAADPAKHADAAANLKDAVDDWVAFNDGLTRDGGEIPFKPTRWWEDRAWRDAAAAGPAGANEERREERPPPR